MSIFDADVIFNVPTETAELVGRSDDISRLLGLVMRLNHPAVQLSGEHGVGKSAVARHLGHQLRGRLRSLNVVYIDCRPALRAGRERIKSREGLVRDLAAATGGLLGLDEAGRDAAVLQRLHTGKWVIILDSFESTIGSDAEGFARQIGVQGQTTVLLVTTRNVEWSSERHILRPLQPAFIQELVHRGLEGRRLNSADIDALVGAAKGLPGLALRGARLSGTGLALQTVTENMRRDLRSYYADELANFSSKPSFRRIITLCTVVTVPMTADRIAEILAMDSSEAADSLLQLRDYGLFEAVGGFYRPNDTLLSLFDMQEKDADALLHWFTWLSGFLPQQHAFSWSKGDVERWQSIAGFVSTFLRIDALIMDLAIPELKTAYSLLGASLSGWLLSQGYWLELDRLADRIRETLWQLADPRALVSVFLLWQLKALLKRKRYDDAWRAVKEVRDRMQNLPSAEQQYVALAWNVCAWQLRHSLVQDAPPNASDASKTRFTLPADHEILQSEARLKEMGEMELVCISINRRGVIALEQSHLGRAEALLSRVIELASPLPHSWCPEILAIAKGNLGVLYNRRERWADALRVFAPAFAQTAQGSERVVMLCETARANYHMRKYWRAWRIWRQAKQLARQLGLDHPRCESDPSWPQVRLSHFLPVANER